MIQLKRSQVTKSLRIGCVLIVVLIIYVIVRFIPSVASFLNVMSRYIFLLGSSIALIFLSFVVMHKMFKEKDWTNLGKAIFGFIGGILLGMIVGDPASRLEISKAIFAGRSVLTTYFLCFIFGVIISEIGLLTRKTGHPLMVFLCSSIAWILIELLSIGDSSVNLNWLLAFLFGISLDQLLRFKSYSETKRYSYGGGGSDD